MAVAGHLRLGLGILTLASVMACGPDLPEDLPSLIQAMGSNDMRVNFAAAHRVERLFGIEGLLAALVSENASARGVAAHSLMRHPGSKTQEALLNASRDGDEYVRMWSAFSLGKIGDESALPRLKDLERGDPSPLVTRRAQEAARALEQRLQVSPAP